MKAETEQQHDEAVKSALKNVAMQIAALESEVCIYLMMLSKSTKSMRKRYFSLRLRMILRMLISQMNIIEKMIIGRLNKELKEVCLLEQAYVKAENKETC
ncbi:MAG: hypothetical protein ACLSGB_08930 [Dorea sp.]